METKANPNLKQEIEQVVALIKEMYNPARIVLFGSQARGTWSEQSDLDILVVDCAISRPMGELHSALFKAGLMTPVDAFKTTSSDIDSKKDDSTNVVTMALSEGVVLFEKK